MNRIADLPGYRRRIQVEPRAGAVLAMLEDDIHGVAVTLRHDGAIVTSVETHADRMPWTTCPGAQAKLVETFTGVPLGEVTARRDKKANCTHFHDLAVLAAAHAGDEVGLRYDILVSDPSGGERLLEIRRDGQAVLAWIEHDGRLTEPAEIAGQTLFSLRDWINALPEPAKEAARLLQWGAIVAHGRTLPEAQQSNAATMPPNCYSFQPDRARIAIRNGERRDFSAGSGEPLAGFADKMISALG